MDVTATPGSFTRRRLGGFVCRVQNICVPSPRLPLEDAASKQRRCVSDRQVRASAAIVHMVGIVALSYFDAPALAILVFQHVTVNRIRTRIPHLYFSSWHPVAEPRNTHLNSSLVKIRHRIAPRRGSFVPCGVANNCKK